ncbi:MAG: hypothetical protein J7599_07620 [Niabella sp.]|nr:hypothetical protein [Niabella sp.]
MSSLKKLQRLMDEAPVIIDPVPVVKIDSDLVIAAPTEEQYYIYPYKSKFEAAKDLKEQYDKIDIPASINLRTTLIKDFKGYVLSVFIIIKKYWRDEQYVRDRISDLITIKNYL